MIYFLNALNNGFKANNMNNMKIYHLYTSTYNGMYAAINKPKNIQLSFNDDISHIFIFLIFLFTQLKYPIKSPVYI